MFNVLGPLTNPAGAGRQLLGVPPAGGGEGRPALGEMMAYVLAELGTRHSWVVSGDDGLDELTTTTESQVWEVTGARVRPFTVSPEDAGLRRASLSDIQPTGSADHAALFLQALGSGPSAPPGHRSAEHGGGAGRRG